MKEIIKHHETCIDILTGVQFFKMQYEYAMKCVDNYSQVLPVLRAKWMHNAEIYKMCIIRLNERYFQYLNKLQHETSNR